MCRTSCCNSCGFHKSNVGKTRQGIDVNWYSQENLDRLWDALKMSGHWLICHSTDPAAHTYGGDKGIKKGKEQVCIGAQWLVYMHIKIMEHFDFKYGAYVKAVGKNVAMSQRALCEMTFDMAIGQSSIFGGAKLAKSIDGSDAEQLVYPSGFEKTVKLFNKIMGTKLP